MVDDIKVEVGSGNVFADLGLSNPEESLAKAELASRIGGAIRERRLTQAAAAAILGIDQPKVSRLQRGYLTNFSVERLMQFLTLLGRDVEISVKPAARGVGRVRVVEGV
ncbi:MAG: XRE family transcriptional regulator [Acetobacteraceae bacterium]|nr:XRE family transcriptional regulator [Acetobacteraceae bacterium]